MSWNNSSIFHFYIYNSTEMQVWQSKCPLRKKKKKKEEKEICTRAFPGYIHTDESRSYPQRVCYIQEGPGEYFHFTANSAIITQLSKLLERDKEANIDLSPCQVKNCGLHFLWSSNLRHLEDKLWIHPSLWLISLNILMHLFQTWVLQLRAMRVRALSNLHSWNF